MKNTRRNTRVLALDVLTPCQSLGSGLSSRTLSWRGSVAPWHGRENMKPFEGKHEAIYLTYIHFGLEHSCMHNIDCDDAQHQNAPVCTGHINCYTDPTHANCIRRLGEKKSGGTHGKTETLRASSRPRSQDSVFRLPTWKKTQMRKMEKWGAQRRSNWKQIGNQQKLMFNKMVEGWGTDTEEDDNRRR